MKWIILVLCSTCILTLENCKKKGCNSDRALNFDMGADLNDNSCEFSRCVFFKDMDQFDGFSIDSVEVWANYSGEPSVKRGILTLTISPDGNLNCDAPGAISFQMTSNEGLNVNNKIFTSKDTLGTFTLKSFTIKPDPLNQCILVPIEGLSRCVFYQRNQYYDPNNDVCTNNYSNGIGRIESIDIYVEGKYLGTTNQLYPGFISDCDAVGTFSYTFIHGQTINWSSKINWDQYGSKKTVNRSGQFKLSTQTDCHPVDVTQ